MGKVLEFKRGRGSELLTIFDVAKFFLAMESMSHKKLQKLCYYAQAWHLAFYKKRLFDGNFEAWVHGPVCPELYQKYKNYGWTEIPLLESVHENIDNHIKDHIQSVYNTYHKLSGDQLEILSHNELPWKKSREGYEEWEPSHIIIDDKLMKEYYWSQYEQSQQI